jgi:excisionase family DNA binding protein
MKSATFFVKPARQSDTVPLREDFHYINKVEVARRLGKTVRTVDDYMRVGILPFYKVGRSVLFRWEDIERHFITNFRVKRSFHRARFKKGERAVSTLSSQISKE